MTFQLAIAALLGLVQLLLKDKNVNRELVLSIRKLVDALIGLGRDRNELSKDQVDYFFTQMEATFAEPHWRES